MRAALTLEVDGHRLVGTHHLPAGVPAAAPGLGFLLLNAAQLPRAGMGDMPVEIADRVAAQGIPAFRFDLPGLGDSPGELPVHVQEYWRSVEEGTDAPLAAQLGGELCRRFALAGILLGGLCGGAITALYACDHDAARCVRGLILLEPNYYLVGVGEAAPAPAGAGAGPRPARPPGTGGPRGLANRLRWWLSLRHPGGRGIRLYRFATRLKTRLLGYRLPPGVNERMVASSRRLVAAGRPALLVFAASEEKRRLLERGVFRSLPPRHRLELAEIHGTNHMLVPGGGKRAVAERVERWVTERVRDSASGRAG
ncbi:MAG: hypothetical protein AB1726_08130 [Planctomycetota bacterium]